MILEQCKGVHCVDLGESFQKHIYLQNFVLIQPRTSLVKFAASRDVCLSPGAPRRSRALRGRSPSRSRSRSRSRSGGRGGGRGGGGGGLCAAEASLMAGVD